MFGRVYALMVSSVTYFSAFYLPTKTKLSSVPIDEERDLCDKAVVRAFVFLDGAALSAAGSVIFDNWVVAAVDDVANVAACLNNLASFDFGEDDWPGLLVILRLLDD